MDARKYLWFLSVLLATALAACSGSGSSGFDISPAGENAAIEQALEERRCVEFEGLDICAAEQGAEPIATASPTPPATAIPSATGTPAVTATPSADRTVVPATATSTRSPLPTNTRTAPAPTFTPTATRTPGMGVAIAIDTGATLDCNPIDAETCSFAVSFFPGGFPPGAEYRIATRTVDPPGPWTIGPPLTPSGAPEMPTIVAPVAVDASSLPGIEAGVQLAVLVFLEPPSTVPQEVELLADSGADLAYLTTGVTIVPGL